MTNDYQEAILTKQVAVAEETALLMVARANYLNESHCDECCCDGCVAPIRDGYEGDGGRLYVAEENAARAAREHAEAVAALEWYRHLNNLYDEYFAAREAA